MNLLHLQLILWLPVVMCGGAISSLLALLYTLDLRDNVLSSDDTALHEVARASVRNELNRVLVWGVFLLMGLAAAGVVIHPVLWAGYMFAVMFYQGWATYKEFMLRRVITDGE